jgi:replication-associated recombination protein RarA
MYTEKELKMFDRDRYYLLISALQKSVRWCEVNESRYFARQLVDMSVPGAALSRLLLIAAEDVGLADPTLLIYVRSCLDDFENLIKQQGIKKKDAFKFPDLCDAVDRAAIAAAISSKSRLLAQASFATLFDIYENENFNGQLPDYLNKLVTAVKNKDEKQALYYSFVAGLFLNSMDRILTWIQGQGDKLKRDLVRQWVEEYKRNQELLVFTGSIAMLCRDLDFTHGEFHQSISK